MRRKGTGVLLAMAAALAAVGPAQADTSVRGLLTIDQHLLRADFAGEVRVVEQSWDRERGLQHVRFQVVDPWFTRWDLEQTLAIATGPHHPSFVQGARYVVFVSGGPWEDSPFTFGAESVFAVAGDGRVRCRSGNPLFGVLNDGFLCTAPELVVGEQVTVDRMREQVLRARARAARRLPGLHTSLSSRPLPLQAAPSAAAREQEVSR
jgi:hypothetical protein